MKEPISPPEAAARSWRLAKWIGAGVMLWDLTVMLASYGTWRDDKRGKARLAFEKKLRAAIAAETPLFAAPELDANDVMVLAYRLGRQIERRPLRCATRHDYFLTAIDHETVGEAHVLAALESGKLALVRLRAESLPTKTQNCHAHSFPGTDKGDNN